MKELVKQVFEIRKKCSHYQDNLNKKLGDSVIENDPRSGVLVMIFNSSTLILELLDYYYSIWSKPVIGKPEEIDRKKKENAERCMMILKMLFIEALSSVEWGIKNSILLYPKSELCQYLKKERKKGKFIYLRGIVENSKNLMQQDEYDCWDLILIIRNCIVHNNGISDKTLEKTIKGRKVKLYKGKMSQGKLDFFIFLTSILVDIYYNWMNKYIENN